MANIEAYKMDGLGNDFLIIDRRKKFIDLSKEKIVSLGKRDNFGFDQVIFIDKESNNITPIVIFNSDGKEVEACGNGARCIAYILANEKKTKNVCLKTTERILKTEIVGNLSVKINMGKPIFDWRKIPLSQDINNKKINIEIDNNKLIDGFALNIGNPHVVFFIEDFLKYDLKKIGPKIENHRLFPERCNVTLAKIEDKKNISVNVWERGAGLTKACGTAACATVVASYLKGLTENTVNIKFNEGILNLELDKNQNIFMTGPVSEIQNIKIEV
tara:strand:+ start:1605 stop:2423 length:819 start_codon:yes stop_codon:yes gene_type:complete